MNIGKSMFVSAYLTVAIVITVFAARSLWISQDIITWGGVIQGGSPYAPVLALAAWLDFLTDEDNRVARILGIHSPHGLPMGMQVLGYDSETVLPTVIITDTGGRILWAHETDNYRVRPEPEVYLSVLRENRVV